MADLPEHVRHIESLAGTVSEIIVVDSQSQDGTMEYLRNALGKHRAIFLDHPPGLYQSWNHAIAAATQEFLTVATVGDPLPLESLHELYTTIREFDADIVVSAPKLIGAGSSVIDNKWPIQRFIETARIKEATEVPGRIWLLYALIYMPATLLSSSAGNLYRTTIMQKHPFPVWFGHPGDSVWSLQLCMEARWVVAPSVESHFTIHERSHHSDNTTQEAYVELRRLATAMLEDSIDELREMGLTEQLLTELASHVTRYGEEARVKQLYQELRENRHRWHPWFLNFKARKLRHEREALRNARKLCSASFQSFLSTVDILSPANEERRMRGTSIPESRGGNRS